ncbi:MAG: thermonuclease family protein [Candidatus Omnitrophota bacterium]
MKKISVILLMIFACGCAANKIYVDSDEVPGLGAEVSFPAGKIVPIELRRVLSGNRIELTNGEVVSYIGVYIPQIHEIPCEAKRLNEKLIMENEIRLEFDTEQRDSRSRLLAYVYTVEGKFINEEIIKSGFAKALNKPPNLKHEDTFLKAEDAARMASRGIWSKDLMTQGD